MTDSHRIMELRALGVRSLMSASVAHGSVHPLYNFLLGLQSKPRSTRTQTAFHGPAVLHPVFDFYLVVFIIAPSNGFYKSQVSIDVLGVPFVYIYIFAGTFGITSILGCCPVCSGEGL